MFEKNGKFYADWRDKKGVRLRKSFLSKRAALLYEAEQKQNSRRRMKKMVNRPTARVVLTTAGSREEARRLGRTVVEEGLAACVSLIPDVESIYRWKGAAETMLVIKTGADQVAALEARLHQLHSYETPELLVFEVDAGSHPYLEWLAGSLRQG
jgi:periplasmic divalent cation tolerance protein